MTTQRKSKRPVRIHSIVPISICCGAALMFAQAQEQTPARHRTQYRVSNLETLGGTSSAGNSINNRSGVAGYSRLTGDQARHAAFWRNRQHHSILDLGTLGGPNSSVTWNVKNTEGTIVGISQTADPDPLGEAWSSAAFYSGPNAALPRALTTMVKWLDGRKMMYMIPRAFRHKFCSFARQSGHSDLQMRSKIFL
jgi:hypothetical protein